MKLPLIKFYTDNLPPNVGGCANAFVVRIRPKYRDDAGIHAHEYEHVRQWWLMSALSCLMIALAAYVWHFPPIEYAVLGLGAHSLLYLLLPSYRLWSEVRAYRIQATYYPDDRRSLFAGFIAANYNLAISVDEALNEIKQRI